MVHHVQTSKQSLITHFIQCFTSKSKENETQKEKGLLFTDLFEQNFLISIANSKANQQQRSETRIHYEYCSFPTKYTVNDI